MKDERLKNKSFIEAWKKAFGGISYCIKTQKNFKIQLIITIIVIICGIYFSVNTIEWMFLTFSIMFVLVTEVINTAIEETVNLCTDKFHPLAKLAKDIAAGAVVLSALNSIIIAIFVFGSKII